MKKKLIWATFTLIIFGGSAFYFIREKNKKLLVPYKNFSEWYDSNYGDKKFDEVPVIPTVHEFVKESPVLKIDTIFRSMQGPLSIQTININETTSRLSHFLNVPELCWLVGYSVDIIDSSTGKKVSDDFMCHNNLDLQNKKVLPWSIATEESFSRLFTLTEGQSKVMFPSGYGIPIFSMTNMVVYSQVLNHNLFPINMSVKHKFTLYYIKERELNFKMKPLFQRSCYVAKLISGPPGEYGAQIGDFSEKDAIDLSALLVSKKEDSCCTGKMNYSAYDPLHDNFGRMFTGHWKFKPGIEVLRTNVTRMLGLKSDTKVHYIAVHVHPFCTSLTLHDLTTDKIVFIAENENFDSKIGMKKIGHYESKDGFMIYKEHKYELISTYTNTTQDIHTAMASMFLYLDEQK